MIAQATKYSLFAELRLWPAVYLYMQSLLEYLKRQQYA